MIRLGTWVGMSFSSKTVIGMPSVPARHLCLDQGLGPPGLWNSLSLSTPHDYFSCKPWTRGMVGILKTTSVFMFYQVSRGDYFLPFRGWASLRSISGCCGGLLRHSGFTGACLLSSFLLFKTKYVRYFVDIWCTCFVNFLISWGVCWVF